MFTEPQTVTVSTVANTLPRVSYGDRNGTFESTAAGIRLRVSHILGKRTRRNVRIDFNKTVADPLIAGVSRPVSSSWYIVGDHPQVGFTDAELIAQAKALTDYLAVAGNLAKLVNGES